MEQSPPPTGIDLSQDRRPAVITVSIVTWLLAISAIVFRITSRRLKGLELWLDDFLIIASAFTSCSLVFSICGYAVRSGLGQHIWAAPLGARRAWALSLFISELGNFFTLVCVKLSILAFYWRSFGVRKSIRIPIWILTAVILGWGIAVIGVTIFQCRPTYAFWSRFDPVNPTPPSGYHCGLDNVEFFYGNAIPTIATDVFMLFLPIPYIYSLRLRWGQKCAAAGVFLVGILVTIVSVLRLHSRLKGDWNNLDVTWNFVDMAIWSVVEVNIAMLCACLPFLRPIINKLSFGLFNISSAGVKPTQSSNFIKFSYKNDHHTSITVKPKGTNESNESLFVVTDSGLSPEQSTRSFKDGEGSIELGAVSCSRGSMSNEVEYLDIRVEHASDKAS